MFPRNSYPRRRSGHRSLAHSVRYAAALAHRVNAANYVGGFAAMQSAATRGFTVVTVVTLVFTPVWKGKHWVDVLTGRKTETTIVKCQPNDPCPARKHITQKIVLPHQ
jgi:hypothetical protein